MSGTWAGSRAAIKTHMHGVTISSPIAETLTAWEYAPKGEPGAESMPYAWILPPERVVTREPGMQRHTDIDEVVVVVVLAGPDGGGDRELLGKRHEAWVDALSDAFDDALSLDQNADWIGAQIFGPEQPIQFEGNRWGFEMRLAVHLSETKTFGA